MDELASRKSRNPMYSLRAFARDLGISTTCLSEVLGSKRQLSRRNAAAVAERLCLTPEQKKTVFQEIQGRDENPMLTDHYLSLEEDSFRLIADWYYFAILNLAQLQNCSASPGWLAKRLGISELEVRGALERLQRMGFIKVEKKMLARTVKPLHTQVPSAAMTRHYRQNLDKAAEALDKTDFDERAFATMTMAINPELLPGAAKLIKKFKHQMAKFLEKDPRREVYTLAIQLFPVTRKENTK